jgi:uncharacterized iron-regulated membrane protein
VLALVMCLLVLGVAGAIVLRWGLREETDKRATAPPPTRRARPARRRNGRRPVRSGVLLVVSTLGIGVVTGVGVALVIGAAALALRSLAG